MISGLRINLLKSNLFGVGVSDHKVSSVATFTRCSLGSFLFSYLGIPIGESMVRVKGCRTRVFDGIEEDQRQIHWVK